MIKLNKIERRSNLSPLDFQEEYLNPQRPVILKDLMKDWPAKDKWSLDFFKNTYGNLEVPVYTSMSSQSGSQYMKPQTTITFKSYIESIEKGKSDYRLFLLNLMKQIPQLSKDYRTPNLMNGFYNEFPFLFFGSTGSKVALHYDIDLSHIFLSQFHGIKRFILFPPSMSKRLYQHPFTVASYVDLNSPDYSKYPALRGVQGYEAYLEPGETIFMPSGFWHYIEYTETSFSMNQRANNSYITKTKGVLNIARHFLVDKGMNKILGEDWRKMKEKMAHWRANSLK